MNHRIRKLFIHKTLHLKDKVNRLYVTRKEKRRRLAIIEDCVDAATLGSEEYTKKSKQKIITADNNNNKNNSKTKRKIEFIKSRKQKWGEKYLYGYF